MVGVGRKKENIACRAACVGRRIIFMGLYSSHFLTTICISIIVAILSGDVDWWLMKIRKLKGERLNESVLLPPQPPCILLILVPSFIFYFAQLPRYLQAFPAALFFKLPSLFCNNRKKSVIIESLIEEHKQYEHCELVVILACSYSLPNDKPIKEQNGSHYLVERLGYN